MSKAEAPTKFLWVDLETTGLYPEKGDRILEIAALITDVSLGEIASYHGLVKHDGAEITELLLRNPFWANRSEGLKQIIGEMKGGRPEAEVEADLMTLADKYYESDETVCLAGNTIRLDRSFIEYWMSDFAAYLHYRMLDVSSFKLWWTAHGKPEYKKQEKHRALDDIRESIAELKHYNQDINFD